MHKVFYAYILCFARKVEEDTNTTLGQMLVRVHYTFVIYFGTTQPPLQTNEGFEDMLEVIMEFYIPNSGNSEKIK